MSRNALLAVVLIAAGVLAGLAATELVRPASAAPGPDAAAPYQVIAGTTSYILLETATGRAWVMFPKADEPRYAWMFTQRLDNEADVRKWKATKTAAE